MTVEIGRLVVKIAGRDAGKKGVIVDILDDKYVLVDGETRRRKVNVFHIEPLTQTVKLEKNASHEDVSKALKELGIETRQTKPRQKTERPMSKRKTSEQLREQKQEKKKSTGLFKPKKKEGKKAESSLEAKAGISEDKKEAKPAEKKETKPKKAAVKKK